MKRRRWTDLQRLGIFTANGGICHLCGGKINAVKEPWELEHVIALAMGGDDDEANLRPAHVRCHKGKTRQDAGNLSKARSREVRHMGAHKARNPLPGSKASGWKKKMSGEVERRQ